MKKKIVLVGAGSTSFGPSTFTDLYLSTKLVGSTIVLHDINKEKLKIVYEILTFENKRLENKFDIQWTTNRAEAFENADFIINSIEVGDRFSLWKQDYEISRKHGSTQILGECGGPGGTFHAWRIIPPIIEIVKDIEKICPYAFLVNFSNPLSRVCLAIKRVANNLKFIGLCHQIGFLDHHLPIIFNKKLEELRIRVAGLNHFAFLFGLEDLATGKDLMPEFNAKAMNYFKKNEDRFEFSILTFEFYKRFGYFPYVGDNHLGEYLQFAEEFTKTQDMVDWINHTDQYNQNIYERITQYYRQLKKGKSTEFGPLFNQPSGERAIPIIEAINIDRNSYESAVNIPNDGLITNLPEDLIIEISAFVNKLGVQGVLIGKIPKNIAALLRIEASIQDLCVEAVLKRSKELALTCLAIDPNVGSFEMAETILSEMSALQKNYLPKFK
jgi:alpha-galactosidase